MKTLIIFCLLLLTNIHTPAQQALTNLSYAALDSLMYIEYKNGAFDKAILYTKVAREKAQLQFGSLDSVYAEYTSNHGLLLVYAGRFEIAEPILVQAKNIREKLFGKESQIFAQSLNNLAGLYMSTAQYEKAEQLYLEAKNIRETTVGNDDPYFANILNNLAGLYQAIGQYEKAEPNYLRAKDIIGKTLGESHPNFASSLHNLAAIYETMGQYEMAEILYLQAINVKLKTLSEAHPEHANSLNSLAFLYQLMGKHEKAEELYLKAKDIREKTLGQLHPDFAATLCDIAGLYQKIRQFDKAEKLFLKAKDIYASIFETEHPDFTTILNNLAGLYQDIGQYEKAEKFFLQTISIKAKVLGKKHPALANSLNNLADLYLITNNLDKALYYCQKSIIANVAVIDTNYNDWANLDKLDYLSNEHINNSIRTLLSILDVQYLEKKDNSKLELINAIAQAGIRLNEKIRHDFTSEDDKLRTLGGNNNFVLHAIKAISTSKKQGYSEEAFLLAEKNKGVLLLDAVKTEKAYQFGDLPDSLVYQENNLQKKRTDLKAQLLKNHPQSVKDSFNIALVKFDEEIKKFTEILKKKYPKYADIKYDNKIASPKSIQAALDEKTALLEYVIGDSVIYIFKITKENIELVPVFISNQELNEKIKTLHNTLSDYKLAVDEPVISYQRFTQNAFWFYKNLVASILNPNQKIKKLVIISDGELGHLPFETFLTKPAPKEATEYSKLDYLIDNYTISYNYSATLWKAFSEAVKNKNNGQILAMGGNYDIVLDSLKSNWRLPTDLRLRATLASLPAARKELETLQLEFNGFFAFDNQACEKKFKEVASDYAVIHLAMHGLLDSKKPILSSLAFTENGDSSENNFLHAYEISKMRLNADLVVLSACETGYGAFQKGNGIASLAQAFAYAGAPALIVSLWQVNDYATSEIMKNLYENLAAGMDKDEALSASKIKYMKNAKDVLGHPAFWSPFILMGNTEPIYLCTKNNYSWSLAALGIVVLGGLAWMMRRKTGSK